MSSYSLNRRGVLDRFHIEIRNAARLHHPDIVTAYSAFRIGESLVLAMEFVEGRDLKEMVESRGPLPLAHSCNYAHQAALGLQHAHERGMVHRDIKPGNLMLARENDRALIKVLDFGLAKVRSERNVAAGLMHEGQMLGTPAYNAPEQISNARGPTSGPTSTAWAARSTACSPAGRRSGVRASTTFCKHTTRWTRRR